MRNADVHQLIEIADNFSLTRHAWKRMGSRSLSPETVRRVLSFGRKTHVRGAVIYAVGRKEAARYRKMGVNLDALDGVQVICGEDGAVITVYRNRDFRGLRPKSRQPRYCRSRVRQ